MESISVILIVHDSTVFVDNLFNSEIKHKKALFSCFVQLLCHIWIWKTIHFAALPSDLYTTLHSVMTSMFFVSSGDIQTVQPPTNRTDSGGPWVDSDSCLAGRLVVSQAGELPVTLSCDLSVHLRKSLSTQQVLNPRQWVFTQGAQHIYFSP